MYHLIVKFLFYFNSDYFCALDIIDFYMDSVNYEESAMMSNKNPSPCQDDIDFETYREALVECQFAKVAPFKEPEMEISEKKYEIDPQMKLKILKSKRQIYDLL
jgi:hypothetical protein